MNKIDPKLLAAAKKVTAHRAKVVIDHIIKFGFISTEELKDVYGYNHPPRAAGDVRDQGIPLITFKVLGKDGRKIGAYKFGNPADIEEGKLGGRKVLSKKLKQKLIDKYGPKCAITGENYKPLYLQVDHRVPYRVSGDNPNGNNDIEDFMLLSGAAQRQKSWACEHCDNYINTKSIEVCKKCYWASPENYSHVALKPERQAIVIFSNEEVDTYKKIEKEAKQAKTTIQEIIKQYIPK